MRKKRFGTAVGQPGARSASMKRKGSEPEAMVNAPLKLTAVFKACKADSTAPKLEPKPPAVSVVVRLLATTNKSSSSLMVEPLIAATQIFDRMQQPDSPEVEQALSMSMSMSMSMCHVHSGYFVNVLQEIKP